VPSWMVGVSASVNLPCIIKSRSSLLALAHPGGPGIKSRKMVVVVVVVVVSTSQEIGWGEHLRNELFFVEWDVKP